MAESTLAKRNNASGAWVTWAENDVDAEQALKMCSSVRATKSTKEICVIIGVGISKQMVLDLEAAFDSVIRASRLDLEEIGACLAMSVKLTLLAWKLLHPRSKTVFLHPSSTVLSNCDELFNNDDEFCALPTIGTKLGLGGTSRFKTEMFVFEPSRMTFQGILAYLIHVLKRHDSEKGKALRGDNSKLTLSAILNSYFRGRWTALSTGHEILTSAEEDKVESIVNQLGSFQERRSNLPAAEPIAIIGLSCRLPDANNENEFWDLLLEGRDATKNFPASRYFARAADFDEQKDIPAGYMKCPIDEFDAKFFHISPREAEFMDPQQRLSLEVAWEALENAAINPQSLMGTNAAVYMGIWAQEYGLGLNRGTQPENFHFQYLGNALCAASARISHFLGLRGPSITMESGCASALEAIHYGCESLRNGTTDLVIGGGVNVVLNPGRVMQGLESFVLSNDGKCKTFDKEANGFARGEACVVFILKRLSDALGDRNEILGLIRGSAANSNGAGSSLGTPNAVAQEIVIKQALRNAGVQPHEISCLEAHGTGTPVGDPLEFHALNSVFGNDPKRTQPLVVGSVKTNIGHTEGVSGASGLLKVLLALKHRLIPRHINFVNVNPNIDLDVIPAIIPQENKTWAPCSKRGLLAGVNSFGLSGTNVHMVVQEPPNLAPCTTPSPREGTLDRSSHILVLSASSEDARAELVNRYIDLLRSSPQIPLAHVAYSASTGRAHLRHRLALIAENSAQALTRLQKGQFQSAKVLPAHHKIGFLFTGQGSQYVGMAKELYETHPCFKYHFDKCNDLLGNSSGFDLASILSYRSNSKNTNNVVNLDDSLYSQPALFCIEYCLAELWRSFGIHPDFVLGHSVGEFAAAVVAGIIALEDGLKLVVERSRLVSSLPRGNMVVLRVALDKAKKMISEFEKENAGFWADIAASNSNDEVVVSGMPDAMATFEGFCKKTYDIHVQKLSATHAFHSRAMDPVVEDYRQIASTIRHGTNPKCKYISGSTGLEKLGDRFDSEYWVAHLRQCVNFLDAFNTLKNRCDVFVEIGAQPVLLGLGMSLVADAKYTWCPSIRRNEGNWATILTSLGRMYTAGVAVDWQQVDSAYARERIQLPYYPFQRQKFWHGGESGTQDSMAVHSRLLHPLLGRRIPSPKTELTSYYNSIALTKVPYLKDHKVTDIAILPAAGYLELILAAGCDAIGSGFKSPIPLMVEDFLIEAALQLPETGVAQIQTTLNMCHSENHGQIKYSVAIYKQVVFDPTGSDVGKWRKVASGTFTPGTTIGEHTKKIHVLSLQETLTRRPSVDDIYERIADTGINFGPLFKSIHGIWYSSTEILFETTLPEASDEYVCHPIVLDAMIQCSVSTVAMKPDGLTGLHLPISIRRFVSMPGNWTCKLYIFIQMAETGHASLHNESGEILGVMSGLDLLSTTIESFLKLTQSDQDTFPTFFDETWRPQLGPRARRMNASSFLVRLELVSQNPDVITTRAEMAEMLSAYDGLLEKSQELCCLYILKSLCELGWKAGAGELGRVVSLQEFTKSAQILEQHARLLRRWFHILAIEGFVQFEDDDHMKVLKGAPKGEELEEGIRDCISLDFGEARAIDLQYVINFGEHLTELMQGKVLPFSLLFPDSPDKVGAPAFYTGALMSSTHQVGAVGLRILLSQVLEAKRSGEAGGDGGKVLRILEIGGGSGGFTEHVLKELDRSDTRYEYTFTDVSPFLLKMASTRFAGNESIKYMLLDIEKDPKTQGYVPHSFDLVAADNVVHATRNLRETLQNLRHLLVTNGVLVMNELIRPTYVPDLSFGFTDGWWRFEDFDVRPDHPTASREQWSALLGSTGFHKDRMMWGSQIFEWKFGVVDTIFAMANDEATTLPASPPDNKSTWLLFGAQEHLPSQYMKTRLESVGESVITAFVGDQFKLSYTDDQSSINTASFVIRLHHGEDYVKLLSTLVERGVQLTGILYLWGMIIDYQIRCSQPTGSFKDHEKVLPEFTDGVMYMAQAMVKCHCVRNVFAVTVGMQAVHEIEAISTDPVPHTYTAILSTLSNEVPGSRFVGIDIASECKVQDESLAAACDDIFCQLWLDDNEFQVAYRNGHKYVRRLTYREPHTPSLNLPNTDRFRLTNPGTGSYSDFVIAPFASIDLPEDHVEVAIKCAGLNFKDVFVALNAKDYALTHLLPGQMSQAEDFRFGFELGVDFAGTVISVGPAVDKFKVGDNVFGLTLGDLGGTFASHVTLPARAVGHMKPGMSFEAHAAIPTVLCSVYHFLIWKAAMKKGDKILIHCASGGVGLLAVQVAQYIGAAVYATAGSNRKRNYLRQFMKIEHIYNSRDTKFAEGILRDTNGYGVDIVLNSLTGPGFKEASLSVCAPKGRFMEMSKYNIWTEDDIKLLRPDVTYAALPLVKVDTSWAYLDMLGDPEQVFKFFDEMFASGQFKEIPLTIFTLGRIHDALWYLQKAKQIGKVVVKIRTTTIREGRIVHKDNLFNEFSSYLITGGLGGIGMEVAKWMASSGAKYLVLVGRNPPTSRAESIVESLRGGGTEVLVLQLDVSNYDGCARMLEHIKLVRYPPLKGIMHAAGVLSNESIGTISSEDFLKTFRPKIHGTWNLHSLTLDYNLDHFVLFSSFVSVLGGIGQSNHCAANRYLNSFASYRTNLGLPCKSIGWGAWSDIGAAANISGATMERAFGFKSFSPAQGIASLQRIMLDHHNLTFVSDVTDWDLLMHMSKQGNLFELVRTERMSARTSEELQRRLQEVRDANHEDRLELIKAFLDCLVRETLKLPDTEPIDRDADLRDLGIDSLMAMELRSKMQGLLHDVDEKSFSIQSFVENRTINKLAALVHQAMSGCDVGGKELTTEELLELVKKDCQLPEDIVACESASATRPSQYKHVLLTGAAGQLGVYILMELTTRRPDLTVTCLIRADSDAKADEKLEVKLKHFQLFDLVRLDKVVSVAGSVTKECFGLAEELYLKLAREVDAVIHCAALMNHVLSYGDHGCDDLRSTNALALHNILRFSVLEKQKAVQHQSAIVILTEKDTQLYSWEELVLDDDWGESFFRQGYALSKFVAEKLLKEAVLGRKLPVTIIRHNHLTGDSKTGLMTTRTDHSLAVLLASRRVKALD